MSINFVNYNNFVVLGLDDKCGKVTKLMDLVTELGGSSAEEILYLSRNSENVQKVGTPSHSVPSDLQFTEIF